MPHGRADKGLRVPPRHNDGAKLQLAGHHAGELEAPGRAVVPTVEQPDERSAVQLLPSDQLALEFEEGIDIVHAECADEGVDACMVPALEESDRPIVRGRMQHTVEGALAIESEEVAHAEGEGHVFFE